MDYEYIEFHNAYGEGKSTFVIDLRSLPPEILVSFRLSNLNLSQPIQDALTNVRNTHEADPIREPVPEVDEITFQNTVYECVPSQLVKIEYVYIDPDEFCAAVLYIKITKPLKPGIEYYFEVLHVVNDDVIVGGSTYVIRSADNTPRLYQSENEEQEEEVSGSAYIHPWLNPPPQIKQNEIPSWISEKHIITSWKLKIDMEHTGMVRYSIENGQIEKISAVPEETKIIAQIQPIDLGKLIIELPRYVLDAKNENREDSKFIVTMNGSETTEYYDEKFTDESVRVLSIDFKNTANEIHIKGTSMIQS